MPANLAALTFFPLGNASWSTIDANAVVIMGPNGVRLQDSSGATVALVTPSEISLSAGGHTLVVNSSGVLIDGQAFATHEHTGVQTGGGNTGPVAT